MIILLILIVRKNEIKFRCLYRIIYIRSFDVVSLYTNIETKLAYEIIRDNWDNISPFMDIPKDYFGRILSLFYDQLFQFQQCILFSGFILGVLFSEFPGRKS